MDSVRHGVSRIAGYRSTIRRVVYGPTTLGEPSASRDDPKRGPIWRIVGGSLLAGFLGALVLTLAVFAGAPEHVISGSALLAFAFAWAMLAVLSTRFTSQPQRWALVPAVFMTVAALALLFLAPGDRSLNAAGWVWPLFVFALAVWMFIQLRRSLGGRVRWLVYPVVGMLAVGSVGGMYERVALARDDGKYAMPGRLIDVGGHSLHINCTGTGSPTVVLEPGLGEPSVAMSWIAPDIATTTRVCVYDRAGRGWSESASATQDGVQVATDLHTLLERAGEPGPYVLAGHSAGGIYVLNFAHLYPQQVAGVVLLDSMHPEQYTKIDGWSTFYKVFRRASALLPSLSRLGLGHVLYQSAYGDLPPVARDEQRTFWSTPRHSRSVRDEFSKLRTAMAQARSLTDLGDRPLVVLTAEKEAEGGWMPAQDELAALSTNVAHRILPNATHANLVENEAIAAQSSDAIRDVVNAVRSGTPVVTQ
jgi:pimeloyl-ACP methyl ester carboxylesterase